MNRSTGRRSPKRKGRLTGAAALCVCLLVGAVLFGFIDPNFTPADLVRGADAVCVGSLHVTAKANILPLAVTETLKGKPVRPGALNLAPCRVEQIEQVRKLLEQNGAAPVILFAGKHDKETRAYLHVQGTWLELVSPDRVHWEVRALAARLSGTWAGGTDMLIRMTRHLLAEPAADARVSVGVSWMQQCCDLGKVPGGIRGMTAVRLRRSGAMHLFVASDAGDRLYRAKPDDEAFEDVTAQAKIASRSREFAWVDMNGDGGLDLVSWDGAALAVWALAKDDTFQAPAPGGGFTPGEPCLGLAPCTAGTDGSAAILVSTPVLPFLVRRGPTGTWTRTALPAGAPAGRTPCPAIVADLNGDGCPDILQPRPTGGVLWQGAAGGFAKPVPSGVTCADGRVRFALGDFNQDGALDLFLSGTDAAELWENDGAGGFTPVSQSAGSLSYKPVSGVADCRTADLNHDGRPDLCLLYPKANFAYHFNRGFRCFGEEGELQLFEPGGNVPAQAGQNACAVADFNNDGSLDLAVGFTDGTVCVYYNQAFNRPLLRAALAAGMPAPVTVSVWTGGRFPICIGTLPVSQPPAETVFALPGPGEFTVRWKPPGQPARAARITVPDAIPEKSFEVTVGR